MIKKQKIAILASGSGTNAENLIKFFQDSERVSVELVLSNRPNAFVLERAKKLNVSSEVFTKKELHATTKVLSLLEDYEIDFVVLAGFLLLVPMGLIEKYQNKIINIHPSLLPKYGGKGMYGDFVHQSVIENGEIESGITIHLVNEKFDEGEVLFQAKCEIEGSDTAQTLATKIHKLEHENFPTVISDYVLKYVENEL